jgi:N-acyl-D-amino-acid deacylase
VTIELLIRGATVYPGDAPPSHADVAVADGRIVALEPLVSDRHTDDTATAREVVDGSGLMLCPGFVDLHAHSALAPFDDPLQRPKLAQGFTTEVICPDGLAPAPVAREHWRERRDYLRPLEGNGPEVWEWTTFAGFLDALDETRPATSLVPSVGHGAVRDLVMGPDDRRPTGRELRAMRAEVRVGIEAGARMLSFGLVYLPGAHAATEELVALAEEAATAGIPVVPHVRNEGLGLLEAVGEMIDVARASGAALHVSHLKAMADERMIGPLLELLDEASDGVSLSFDQYPYGAGSTLLASILPRWAQEGGADATLARLTRPEERTRIARDVADGLPGWENLLGTLGPERIAIADAAAPHEEAIGRTLADLAGDRSLGAAVDIALDLLTGTGLDVTMVLHYAGEAAVWEIARHPLQLVGSDGIFGGRPHPRLWGTAARFLGRLSLRGGVLTVEEAIARLTSRPAALLGLADRGRIAEGLRADLVLLDPERFVDTATYDDPCRAPDGVVGVWIAGERVWRGGAPTGARPGGVVR